MKGLVLLLVPVMLSVAYYSEAREPLTDHPLIAPYEGSEIRRKKVQEFEEYNAFMGMDETGKEPQGIALEGKVTKLFYNKPKERSILEVFRNYEQAIAQEGAEILYTCNQEKKECVARYAGPTLQKYSDIHAISNLKGRYLLARFTRDDNTAYVAVAVGQTFTDIHVIEVKDMDVGMVTLDAEALWKALDMKGFVIVEGIYFDTNKASLKSSSADALEQLSVLLKDRPDLQVYVVGHTDMQGSFDHNLDLSKRRANTVVSTLASDYGVPRAQMEGHGVGPLAPQATNNSDAGRAKNRRVVLVAR